jgi:hypothetical protein
LEVEGIEVGPERPTSMARGMELVGLLGWVDGGLGVLGDGVVGVVGAGVGDVGGVGGCFTATLDAIRSPRGRRWWHLVRIPSAARRAISLALVGCSVVVMNLSVRMAS